MSPWRRWCWPIERSELPKFLPIFFIKLFLSFNYTILAATKDTVVVTSSGGGAEIIPVLKGGVVIVIAFLVMLLYTKLSNVLTRARLFYLVTWSFLIYFLLYGAVLFPYREIISPQASSDYLLQLIGIEHNHWVAVYRYWMNSIFFVAAELWGGMMIAVLFWSFANQVTNIKDAARFYGLYAAGGHVGTILAGSIIYSFASYMQDNKYETTVLILMLLVVVSGLTVMSLYSWTYKNVLAKQDFIEQMPRQDQDLNAKTKLSLRESIAYILRSPYLGLIALMVIGYGLSVNLVEVTWKAILKIRYPDPNEYQAFMGALQTCIGIISLLIAIFLGSNVLRKFGWRTAAQITPVVLGLTSVLFFGVYFAFPDFTSNQTTILSFTPLMLLVAFGTVHNISCKAMKYCLFDTTKEIAYIPLDPEAKIKGKAAVDLVGARFGKSGSSWLQLGLIDLVGAGSILGVVPLLVPFVAVVVAAWLVAVHNLDKRFAKLQKLQFSTA
jgi:AAA family ATP:ADP antiporter